MSKSTFIVLMTAVAVYTNEVGGAVVSLVSSNNDRHRSKEIKLLETDFRTTAQTFAETFADTCGLRDHRGQINLDRVPHFTTEDQGRVIAMFPKDPGFYIKNISISHVRVVEKKPMKVTKYKYTEI